MRNRNIFGVIVLALVIGLLLAFMVIPAFATDPSPATLDSIPQVRKLEQGATARTNAVRVEFDYRDGYPQHAQIELYASAVLSTTNANATVTLTVQSSALGNHWVSHSDLVTFVGASPANAYVVFPQRGMKMAILYSMPATQTITPTVELVFSNRQ